LAPSELRLTNLITTDRVADVLPRTDLSDKVAGLKSKSIQDRFASAEAETDAAAKSTKTAEATAAVAPAPAGK